jgi:hypothetical protein
MTIWRPGLPPTRHRLLLVTTGHGDGRARAGGWGARACEGLIEMEGLSFAYPSRPEQPVLRDFSLRVRPGQTVALCGASGSGKSTTMQLLERFYDPTDGVIKLVSSAVHCAAAAAAAARAACLVRAALSVASGRGSCCLSVRFVRAL